LVVKFKIPEINRKNIRNSGENTKNNQYKLPSPALQTRHETGKRAERNQDMKVTFRGLPMLNSRAVLCNDLQAVTASLAKYIVQFFRALEIG
jgi:hypothetical protein